MLLNNQCGALLHDRYEVWEEIGEGGCAKVYLGWDRHILRPVALKRLKSQDSSAVRRFQEEAAFLKGLRHPMIPVVYDLFEQNGWYLVMEYVEGVSLQEHIAKNGRMEEGAARAGAVSLLKCLSYLHNRIPSVIYCDLKPGNIIVCRDGTWKLVDWGGAFAMRYGGDSPKITAGTHGYAAPEQTGESGMENLRVDARSDLYAFGKTLYYAVTGADPAKPPYGKLSIRCYEPTLSGGMQNLITVCTRADPSGRYRSAEEAIKAFGTQNKKAAAVKKRDFIRKIEKQVWLTEQKGECTFYRDSCIIK